jgi:hypothetical protein
LLFDPGTNSGQAQDWVLAYSARLVQIRLRNKTTGAPSFALFAKGGAPVVLLQSGFKILSRASACPINLNLLGPDETAPTYKERGDDYAHLRQDKKADADHAEDREIKLYLLSNQEGFEACSGPLNARRKAQPIHACGEFRAAE